MYKLAVFDLDGTLLDTLDDIAASCNRALWLCGFPLREKQEYRQFLGFGMRRLVQLAMPEEARDDEGTVHRMMELHREYYGEHATDATGPYPGISRLLGDIRRAGVRTAVLSNKPHDPTVLLTERFFPDLMDYCAGQREGVPTKPDPAAVTEIIARFGFDKADCVYIGDSEVDARTGRNAGIDAIGVTWGFRDCPVLQAEGLRMIADTAKELSKFILDKA